MTKEEQIIELRKEMRVFIDKNQTVLGIYAIYDIKSQQYDTPFFAISDLYAKRRYMLMSDEEKSPLSKWPEDFELHNVGHFGCQTGEVVEKIVVIYKGKAHK